MDDDSNIDLKMLQAVLREPDPLTPSERISEAASLEGWAADMRDLARMREEENKAPQPDPWGANIRAVAEGAEMKARRLRESPENKDTAEMG